jgi:hypothetical protein
VRFHCQKTLESRHILYFQREDDTKYEAWTGHESNSQVVCNRNFSSVAPDDFLAIWPYHTDEQKRFNAINLLGKPLHIPL